MIRPIIQFPISNSASLAPRTDQGKLRLTRWLALAIGAVVVVGTIGVGSVHGNIFEVAGKTVNLLGCPLFGIFFLALFVPYSTPLGAMMGVIYSITAAVIVAYWDVPTGLPSITFQWIAPISLAASLAAGCFFSLWNTRGRSPARLAGYSAAALLPLVAACGLLLRAVR